MKNTIKHGLLLQLSQARRQLARATEEAGVAERHLAETRASQADAETWIRDIAEHLRSHGVSDDEIGETT